MLVDFIVPFYNRTDALRSMLSSLLVQTDNDWKATVIVDTDHGSQENLKYYNEACDLINSLIGYNTDGEWSKIMYGFTDKRYNDWGHTPREIGKQQSMADYIIMTGDDNYYTPNFVAELKKATINKPGMVYWDMVHSHYDYSYFNCQPAYNQIDMGAFATRNDLAKQIKLNTSYAADGEFVRDFNIKFPQEQKIKINKCLFVHN